MQYIKAEKVTLVYLSKRCWTFHSLSEAQFLNTVSLWDALLLVLCPLISLFHPLWTTFRSLFGVTVLLSSLLVVCEDGRHSPSPGRPAPGRGEMLVRLTGLGCEWLRSELSAGWLPASGPPSPHPPEYGPTSALRRPRSAGRSPFLPACRPPGSCQSAPPSPSCAHWRGP